MIDPLKRLATYGSVDVLLLNDPLTFVPMLVIVPMQTTTIRASITAYSTAVGPSSDARNFLIWFMIVSLSESFHRVSFGSEQQKVAV